MNSPILMKPANATLNAVSTRKLSSWAGDSEAEGRGAGSTIFSSMERVMGRRQWCKERQSPSILVAQRDNVPVPLTKGGKSNKEERIWKRCVWTM